MTSLPKKLSITLRVIGLAYCILLTIITLDTINLTSGFWQAWFLQITPLILLLPGLLMRHYRSYSWLCFLMLLYFTSFVVQVYSPTRDSHDWVALMLSLLIFSLAMFASRWLQRYSKGIL